MAEHSLPEGKRWIENLLAVGRALSYQAEGEYDVAPEGEEEAPVDVAWLRSTEDEFPLFIFEVESRPSGQMTYNAAKVFAQSSELFEKPLFHFHLVVSGGETSGRLRTSQDLFGQFNYRVYRVADGATCTRALCDIFSQHRRVADELDVVVLATAIEPDAWPGLDLDTVWLHVEACGFRAPWEAAYAQLAAHDASFRARLGRRLGPALDEYSEDPPGEQYPSWLVRQCAPLLHVALLGMLSPARRDECLAALERWRAEGSPSRLVPAYGASEAFDDLVFARMPLVWAALAAAIPTAGVRALVLEQMAMSLGPTDHPNPLALSAITAVWMLHVARSGGEQHRGQFERAREHLVAAGGIAPALLDRPPSRGASMGELDAWARQLAIDATAPPSWDDFPDAVLSREIEQPARELDDELVSMLGQAEPELDPAVVLTRLWATAEEVRR